MPCPEESVDPAATGHLFVEGDNLEVLKLLFKPYFGRVKMIYREIALKHGFPLTSRIEPVAAGTNTVCRVSDALGEQSFLVCLDEAVRVDIARALGPGPDDLFVCRDRALDDTAAANLALQCRLKTI